MIFITLVSINQEEHNATLTACKDSFGDENPFMWALENGNIKVHCSQLKNIREYRQWIIEMSKEHKPKVNKIKPGMKNLWDIADDI